MRYGFVLLSAVLGLLSHAALAKDIMSKEKQDSETAKAFEYIQKLKPEKALKTIAPVLASFEAQYTNDEQTIYCTKDLTQTLLAMGKAAQEKKSALAIGPTYCSAIFAKGFALIDVKQHAEALYFLKKASDMAPLEAHYMNEYAEWYKTDRQWQVSHDLFEKASGLAVFTNEQDRDTVSARSLRGMAFNLIELGELDEAEKLLKESQKLDPENRGAEIELKYIKQLREKQGS